MTSLFLAEVFDSAWFALTAAMDELSLEALAIPNKLQPSEASKETEAAETPEKQHHAGSSVVIDDLEDAGSVASSQKPVYLTINGKRGEAPQKVEILSGGLMPCMVCGRYFDNMPPHSAFCWVHKRAVDNLESKWKPLPTHQQGAGYANNNQEKLDILRKYRTTKTLPPSQLSKLVLQMHG